MNLLLNAANLRHGGGRTVALQLINGVAPLRTEDTLYVMVPQQEGFESLAKHRNIILLPIPESFHSSWLVKLRYMHHIFPNWCKKLRIDKVMSLGNTAFPTRKRPQLVYIQLPQMAYPDSQAWKTMNAKAFLLNSLMDQYVAFHMRYASSYAVQTLVMKSRLTERFKLPEDRVFIIPNAPIEPEVDSVEPLEMPIKPLKLLFLSRYYPHKSFEILPELAQLLKEQNLPITITITISEKEASGAAKVLEALRGFDNIINIGPVEIKEVGRLVNAHHGIFHPSLMESFSGAYSEALLHRRLIFTSHYDFATELLGDAAFYFDPLKPEHIVSTLKSVLDDDNLVQKKLREIDKVATTSARIADVSKIFSDIIDTFA